MSYVKRNDGESIESLLARFHRQFQSSGILKDLKKHEFYEKPCVKRRRKRLEAALRRLQKEKKVNERTMHKVGNKKQDGRRNRQPDRSNGNIKNNTIDIKGGKYIV